MWRERSFSFCFDPKNGPSTSIYISSQVNPDRNLSFVEMLPFFPDPVNATKGQGRVDYPIGKMSMTLFTGGQQCIATKKVEGATPQRINIQNKRGYECSACGFRRVTRAAIQTHITRHHEHEEKKRCRCGFQTVNYDVFNQHKRRCSDRYECKSCGYQTTRKSSMKKHLESRKHKFLHLTKSEKPIK